MICRRCGRELTPDDAAQGFCPVCGEPMGEGTQPAEEPPEELSQHEAPQKGKTAPQAGEHRWRREDGFVVCPLCEASYYADDAPERCERCAADPEHAEDVWLMPAAPGVLSLLHTATGQDIEACDGLYLGRHYTECLRDNLYVSRKHAVLLVRGEDVLIRDEGSANGTFVNGQRLEPGAEQILSPGDQLALDEEIFTVKRQSAGPPARGDAGQ